MFTNYKYSMRNIAEFIKEPKAVRQAHLRLDEPCCERGGNSTNHKGVLAEYLNTTIPSGRILLCHACNNSKCSNPRHIYWGTDRENTFEDGKLFGTWQSPWDRSIEKYGLEEARRQNSKGKKGNNYGAGNKGKSKSEEHKQKIAAAIKARAKEHSRKGISGRTPKVSYDETVRIWTELGLTDGAKYFGITLAAFKSRVALAKARVSQV